MTTTADFLNAHAELAQAIQALPQGATLTHRGIQISHHFDEKAQSWLYIIPTRFVTHAVESPDRAARRAEAAATE